MDHASGCEAKDKPFDAWSVLTESGEWPDAPPWGLPITTDGSVLHDSICHGLWVATTIVETIEWHKEDYVRRGWDWVEVLVMARTALELAGACKRQLLRRAQRANAVSAQLPDLPASPFRPETNRAQHPELTAEEMVDALQIAGRYVANWQAGDSVSGAANDAEWLSRALLTQRTFLEQIMLPAWAGEHVAPTRVEEGDDNICRWANHLAHTVGMPCPVRAAGWCNGGRCDLRHLLPACSPRKA